MTTHQPRPAGQARAHLARTSRLLALLLVPAMLLSACAQRRASSDSPYLGTSEAERDPDASQRLAQRALAIMDDDAARAESLLREALALDLYNGAAHNNLGTILLSRSELYEAANEFEWARKLLPGHPDPRVNLALTLERAGRTDDALAGYDAALEVYPGHLAATQGLVRLQLRAGRADDRTPTFLRQVALAGETATWRDWAHKQMALRGVE